MATKYRRQQFSRPFKIWTKMWALIALIILAAWFMFKSDNAHAMASAPAISAFFYKTPSGADMEVVSWFSDGVKCTMTRARGAGSYGYAPALSCVSVSR